MPNRKILLILFIAFLVALIFAFRTRGNSEEIDTRRSTLIERLASNQEIPREYVLSVLEDSRIEDSNAPRTSECVEIIGARGKEGEWLLEHPEYGLLGHASLALGIAYYREHRALFQNAQSGVRGRRSRAYSRQSAAGSQTQPRRRAGRRPDVSARAPYPRH